jgi:cold shock CspA family protein
MPGTDVKEGKVKSWNDLKGFGFIEIPGEEDLFVHRTNLVGVDALNVGDDVKFVIGFDDRKKKNRAENVTGGTGAKGRGKGFGQGSHHGTVKSWNDERGFGFIETPGEEDIFVHRNDLNGADALNIGDRVSYNREYDDRKGKHCAKSVSGGTGMKGGGGKGVYGGYQSYQQPSYPSSYPPGYPGPPPGYSAPPPYPYSAGPPPAGPPAGFPTYPGYSQPGAFPSPYAAAPPSYGDYGPPRAY